MFQKILLLSLALILSSCSLSQRSQLDWQPMGVKGVVYASGIQINRPSSANWEVLIEYDQDKVVKQLNLREVVAPGSNHTVVALVKAVGSKSQASNAEDLAQLMISNSDYTRGLRRAAYQVTVGKACQYECVRFEFRANQRVSEKDVTQEFQFHGLGYRFIHPSKDIVCEVLFTERFHVGSSRKYSNITVESFLKSFRFD